MQQANCGVWDHIIVVGGVVLGAAMQNKESIP